MIMKEKRIRVVLYEANDLMRYGVRFAFKKFDDIELIADLASFPELIHVTEDLVPDLLVLDSVTLYDPIEYLKMLREINKSMKIVFLSDSIEQDRLCTLLRNGVDAVTEKDADADQLFFTLMSVMAGNISISKELFSAANLLEGYKKSKAMSPCSLGLSAREAEVLELIVNGRSNDQISKELFISLATTKTHVRNILNKLNVEDRTQAAVKALRSGLYSFKEAEEAVLV